MTYRIYSPINGYAEFTPEEKPKSKEDIIVGLANFRQECKEKWNR